MKRRRVFLHVGTPKSGTSYLQDTLARNRDLLESQRMGYPRTRSGDHFQAALDLLGQRWAGAEAQAEGQWDALVGEARRSRGSLVVSHEILAGATAPAVARAIASFPDHEPHVVLTVRDLGRQIPAEWQERVKHRARRDFATYLRHTRRHHGDAETTGARITPFWRVQDVPRILATWGGQLPPSHVHVVTVGAAGGPKDQLWQRFAQVLGLDPTAAWQESPATNASLGGAEVTALRLLNAALAERGVSRETYVRWVRESVVKDVLAGRRESPRATVPPRTRPWVEEISAGWIEQIRALGVDVVGDLDELRPRWPDAAEEADGWIDPDAADPELVSRLLVESLAHVLDHIGPRRLETSPLETGPVARIARRLRG